jgi:hypothetical protein
MQRAPIALLSVLPAMGNGFELSRRDTQIGVYGEFSSDPQELSGFHPQRGRGIALLRTMDEVVFTLLGVRRLSVTSNNGGIREELFKHGRTSFFERMSNHVTGFTYVVSIRKERK